MPHDPNSGAGKLKILAAILERPVVQKILARLGLERQAPPKAPEPVPSTPVACRERGLEDMDKEFEVLKNELIDSYYGKLYKKNTGNILNPLSDTQLKKLLFSILKVKPIAYTDKGKSPKLDQEVIEELSKRLELDSVRQFIQDIVRLRKLRKTNSTYLKGFLREIT